MSDDQVNDEGGWLLEPPAAGEVHFNINLGSGVELSSEARDALEILMRELEGAEVEGHSFLCPTKGVCNPRSCHLDNCQPKTTQPCANDYRCKIVTDFSGMG